MRLDKTHDRPIRASRAGTVAALQQERSSSCGGDGDGDVDVDVDGDDGRQSLHPAGCRRESADQASPSRRRACWLGKDVSNFRGRPRAAFARRMLVLVWTVLQVQQQSDSSVGKGRLRRERPGMDCGMHESQN